MTKDQKDFFNKAEETCNKIYKKFKADGESDLVSITLSIAVLDKLFLENGLIYDFYKQVLEDLETMYLNPGKIYEIYKKYGIIEDMENIVKEGYLSEDRKEEDITELAEKLKELENQIVKIVEKS